MTNIDKMNNVNLLIKEISFFYFYEIFFMKWWK